MLKVKIQSRKKVKFLYFFNINFIVEQLKESKHTLAHFNGVDS